ncbi:MAG: hypothetical protein JOZ80_08840 [Acidobacteriaceae bacterium]|nr:hypothetical protein [Acidobacteriaceae bacterium]
MAVVVTTIIAFVSSDIWLMHSLEARLLLDLHGSFFEEGNLFNILIALVFGFSSLNILALAARGVDHRPSSLKPGEVLALTAMVLSICFLGMELLHLFHVFPIHLGGY